MGHCEMTLAVAGLSDIELHARCRRLAEGDWSSFPAAERVAYRFAWKLTRAPWTVTTADLAALVAAFGRRTATAVAWQVAWGAYMTRVAEALQLPLETTNVFAPPLQRFRRSEK